jgi:hypothetical protein
MASGGLRRRRRRNPSAARYYLPDIVFKTIKSEKRKEKRM